MTLVVNGNAGGASVTGNTVAKRLVVTGDSGTVLDRPNTVAGKTKLRQGRGRAHGS